MQAPSSRRSKLERANKINLAENAVRTKEATIHHSSQDASLQEETIKSIDFVVVVVGALISAIRPLISDYAAVARLHVGTKRPERGNSDPRLSKITALVM